MVQDLDKIALVLEGGGFRGMYTAGVLDAFLQNKIYFNYIIGVSAGAAYSVSYISRQIGRNLDVNQYINDSRYCGWGNLLRDGSYFNWDFVYRIVPMKYVPFHYDAFAHSSSQLKVVVTNVETGNAEYVPLRGSDPINFRNWLTATSSLPVISQPKQINNSLYMDGGLSDSIPVQHALLDGNKRAVVVLTRPQGYTKGAMKGHWLMKLLYRKYPHLPRLMKQRAAHYNKTIELLEQMESEGRIFVIRPHTALTVSRLDNNPGQLNKLYYEAISQMEETLPKLKQWLNCCN